MRQPTLFLTVGLPCTGKTNAARRIEIEQKALRLTKDEWVKALYGHENPPSAQDVIEGRLIQIGLRALELGNNVVIDYGLWGRDGGLPTSTSQPQANSTAVNPSMTHRLDSLHGTSGADTAGRRRSPDAAPRSAATTAHRHERATGGYQTVRRYRPLRPGPTVRDRLRGAVIPACFTPLSWRLGTAAQRWLGCGRAR